MEVKFIKIKDCFELIKGMSNVKQKWSDTGNCKFIDYLNVFNNQSLNTKKLCNATVSNMDQDVLKKGDILFTSASETLEECALASVIEEDIEDNVFLDDHLFGLRVKEDYMNIINPSYLKYYFNGDEFNKMKIKVCRGVTRYYVSKKEFMEIMIPVPSMEIQNRVVNILDRYTYLVKNKNESLEKEKELLDKLYNELHNKTLLNYDDYNLNTFDDVVDYDQPYKYIVNSTKYDDSFKVPVLTAGKSFVLGYTNEDSNIYDASVDNPVIIFDDFTTSFHYVDFPFKVKSSAMKILKPKENINLKFIYYYMKSIDFKVENHTRQWISKYSKLKINLPSMNVQNEIVKKIDNLNDIYVELKSNLDKEHDLTDKQYSYYLNEMLNF